MGADLLPVNMFWMGPRLSMLETGCMLSALRAGHAVTVFSYEKPSNLPAGIQWENAAGVLPRENFVLYRGQGAALGSNLFRYRLMEQQRGLWLDTDMLVLKPIIGDGTEIFGWQNQVLINSAVLFLPPHSPVLRDLLAFTSDLHPRPPFLDRRDRLKIGLRRAIGRPMHVSRMPWGVWGPNALTHFIRRNGCEGRAQPCDVFYPVPFEQCETLIRAGTAVEDRITPATRAIHLWNEGLRRLSGQQERLSEPGAGIDTDSFVGRYFIRELGMARW